MNRNALGKAQEERLETADAVIKDADHKMAKSVEVVHDQFSGIRTGKASPALVENIKVMYYGNPTRLREIAGISTPEPSLITITPYDPTASAEIEKALLAANLGVTPINDGRLIRVPIPPLSEERREEMIKLSKKIAEDGRIAVRNVRREANDHIKSLQKDGKISEDDREHGIKEVQKHTDNYIGKIDGLVEAKEKEITAV